MNALRRQNGLDPLPETARIQACHVVSIRSAFWSTAVRVAETHDIFSPEGVKALKTELLDDEFHGSPRFMIGLCRKHDKLVPSILKKHISERQGS